MKGPFKQQMTSTNSSSLALFQILNTIFCYYQRDFSMISLTFDLVTASVRQRFELTHGVSRMFGLKKGFCFMIKQIEFQSP